MWTILAPKGRHQRRTKHGKNCLNIILKFCISLRSRFYPGFLLNFLFCPSFLTFWDKFQAISGPGQIKLKSPGFPGSAGNPVYSYSLCGGTVLVTWYLHCVGECFGHMVSPLCGGGLFWSRGISTVWGLFWSRGISTVWGTVFI